MAASIEVYPADFMRERQIIEQLRIMVFVREQGVPEDMEMDDRDIYCQHFLARCDGTAVGTVRLDMHLEGKVGRLAVVNTYRRRGVGHQLIKMLHQSAQELGLSAVWCHAQLSAEGFYSTLGYQAHGPIFEEAGIAHIAMHCDFSR